MSRAPAIIVAAALLSACQAAGPAAQSGGAPSPRADAAGLAQPQAVAPSEVTIGKRLLSANQPEMALSSFQRSIVDEGVTAEALVGIAVANLQLGRRKTAVKFLHAAIDANPNSAVARNNLGVMLFDEGDYAAAASEFQSAYAITGGTDASIATNLAMAERARENQRENAPIDEGDYVVIQYGHGVYRLEPRADGATSNKGDTRS